MSENLQQQASHCNVDEGVVLTVEVTRRGGDAWVRALIDGVDIPDDDHQAQVVRTVMLAAASYLMRRGVPR